MKTSFDDISRIIINQFDAFFADYRSITLGAKTRFEQADWPEVQIASVKRLELYKQHLAICCDQLLEYQEAISLKENWQPLKLSYRKCIDKHENTSIAATFYNSLFCEIFDHSQLDEHYAFVYHVESFNDASSVEESTRLTQEAVDALVHRYHLTGQLVDLIDAIISDYPFAVPFIDKQQDIRFIVEAVKTQLLQQAGWVNPEDVLVEVLKPVFYRNKAAYLIGRIQLKQDEWIPFVIPFLHNKNEGIYVDALITRVDDVSMIFSFTRSYFMVDVDQVAGIIGFLRSLIPNKPLSEIYSSIGLKKHAKTIFYRQFLKHLSNSSDNFTLAPGIKGMVMLVFTLPSSGIVFKVIRDRFAAPKNITHDEVKQKYQLVTHHDRAGRMADTQEFTYLKIPKNRICDTLMQELKTSVPSQIIENDQFITIRHLYIERRMTPLNLYLQSANDEQISEVMDEYGNAIKQLAAVNIFPGDMLLKNFGVTRHNRVVFYDYDEISYLTDCNFRVLPQAQTIEQEMAGEPWYDIEEEDVFPEEFPLFFSGNIKAKYAFEEKHSDLYKPSYWQKMQQVAYDEQLFDMFPYRRSKRFKR